MSGKSELCLTDMYAHFNNFLKYPVHKQQPPHVAAMTHTLSERVKKKLIRGLGLSLTIRRKVVSRFVQTLGYII